MKTEDNIFITELLRNKRDNKKLKNFIKISNNIKTKPIYNKAYPVWLTIDPTNICTLKCPFCPTGFGNLNRPKGRMSFWDFKKILDILGDYLLHIDMQNWGEPLLNEDIYYMISYAKTYDVHLTLSTNFQQFDEVSAEAMIKSKLDRLIVSIDGASQKTYEKYRRRGNFNKALDSIRLLVRKKKEMNSPKPFAIWQFLVFRHNEHELKKAQDMADELGIVLSPTTAFIAVDSPEFRGWVPKDKRYSRYNINKKEAVDSKKIPWKSKSDNVCNWLWGGITINWDGTVSPCCGVYKEEDDFGDILKVNDFQSLWNNNYYRAARSYVKNGRQIKNKVNNACTACNKIGQINYELDQDYWVRG